MKRMIAIVMLGIFALVTITGCHASGDVGDDHAGAAVDVH